MWSKVNFAVQVLNFKYRVMGQTKNKMVLYCKKSIYFRKKKKSVHMQRTKTIRPKLSDKLLL